MRAREDAYRANNFGVALLEQFKPKEAAEQFRRALGLDARLPLARINLAIALYNVPDVEGARKEAEAAAAQSPGYPQPHYILGLIAKQQGRVEDALASFARVLKIDPRDVGANVQTGQLLAQQRKYDEAVAAFRVALAEEPYNGTALYNLGTTLLRAGRRAEGQADLQRFQALRASGAATIIGQNYLEQGRYAEAVTSTGAEADLVEKRTPPVRFVDATASMLPSATKNKGAGALKSGAGEWKREGDCGWSAGEARFGGAGALLFDFDGDGRLDLLEIGDTGLKLYRNDGGRFVEVTAGSGALGTLRPQVGVMNIAAVAGDYDNDGREDLFILRDKQSVLLHNDGGGKFSDRTTAAGIPAYAYFASSVAFVDVDHDGDLDIFIAGGHDLSKELTVGPPTAKHEEPPGPPNMLLRNNGNGTFTDITAQAKVNGEGGHGVQVIPTDFDNRRDVDLFVLNESGPPSLYRNMRDGTFRNVAAEVGLDLHGNYYAAAAAGDVNKDGFTDFYFATWNSPPVFAMSDGRGHFHIQPAPVPAGDRKDTIPVAAQFIDYDNDGLLDLVTLSSCAQDTTLHIWRNVGDGWVDVSEVALGRGLIKTRSEAVLAAPALVSADLDGDGDTDLVVYSASGDLIFLRNEGGNRNHSLRVQLSGKVSNRSGVEAKVEVRAGSLQQKLETYAASPAPAPADLVFGLGRRESADAVRVLWPSGVLQAETQTASREGAQSVARVEPGTLKVTEVDRKPSSCPYLYTWNGERFEFITDFMGGGEMGDWEAPGRFDTPDPDEYVRIRGDQLKARDGRYELRVTNELEEALFVDRLQLVAVSHPEGVEVYPNEGLGNPTGPAFKLYAAREAHPPRSAFDERGQDVLAQISKLDRRYPDDFKLLPIRGYAAEHTLTLDLGKTQGDQKEQADTHSSVVHQPSSIILLLTGWTDYAFSSDNVAASQQGLEIRPPALQVRDREGNWQTVIENIGFPVGRPQTVPVDLTGKFLSSSREVRIVTNMRIYWDQVLVGESNGESPTRVERLEASEAVLRPRGFSAEVTPDGREPFSYDYARVSTGSHWKLFTGRYTRFGDVRELLRATDDMFVVSEPGDELALSFDANQLKPLPAGWTRTFLLYADGFSKEMDINSASPHELAPMPFHGMKRYPYAAPESYPADEAHRAYVERYNTRVVASTLPPLVAGR